MEILGHTPEVVQMHYHWRDGDDEERTIGAEWAGEDMSAGWHTFAVHWTPRQLRWFVDGVPRWTVTERPSGAATRADVPVGHAGRRRRLPRFARR